MPRYLSPMPDRDRCPKLSIAIRTIISFVNVATCSSWQRTHHYYYNLFLHCRILSFNLIWRILFISPYFTIAVRPNLSHSIGLNFSCNHLEYHEQNRNDEDLEYHTDQHTADGSSTQSTVTVSTYTHRQASTEANRLTMANEVIRIGRRRAAAPNTAAHVILIPMLTTVEGELYDQDGVLRQQTHQHDQRDLHIDIV